MANAGSTSRNIGVSELLWDIAPPGSCKVCIVKIVNKLKDSIKLMFSLFSVITENTQ